MKGLILLFALVACGGSTEPSMPAYVGEYTLTTVDGHPLPFVLAQDATTKDEVVSGSVILRANMTGDFLLSFRQTTAGHVIAVPLFSTGTYVVNDHTITLTTSDQVTYVLAWNGHSELNDDDGDHVYRFVK